MWTMKESEKKPTFLLQSCNELRKIILENPDLPIVIEQDGESGMFATDVDVRIGEVLDCMQDINELVHFTDRQEFEDSIDERIYGLTGYDDRDDEWYAKQVKKIAKAYDPYWRKCIIVDVMN